MFIVSIFFAAVFAFSTFCYVLSLIGAYPESLNLTLYAMLSIVWFPMIIFKWVRDIEGCYHGKVRLQVPRKILLSAVIVMQPINIFFLSDFEEAIVSGIVMLFSLLTFYTFFFGKKHGRISWFKFY